MTIHPITPGTDIEASGPTKRESLESRHQAGIASLLERKSELRGVHAMADFLDDAVRWTA